jgi:hypothetical protein
MSFEDPSADYTRFYRAFSERLVNDRAIRKSSDVPMLVLSEHNVSDERVVTVAVNHGSGRIVATLQVNPGIEAVRILSGSGAIDDAGQLTIELDVGEAAVIEASQVVMPDIAADGDAKRCEWVSRSDGNNIQRLQNDKPALISSD